ncbi:MAG: mannose-1-phosphate guanylyltransferase/mannose-6-phosphate isomerase [Desulfobacterales bacterium]|nr:mannose-1-phosphate guanylyltransferase/mannose-6-phosphate isomerase [Desulfobacterales bacterium]
MIKTVILAGGSGTRLWPLSRNLNPKQLLKLVDDNTMLQNTLLRFSEYAEISKSMIICNENHRFIVAEQLRKIKTDSDIILEPIGRDTAPALTVSALEAYKEDKNAIIIILPADHNIDNIDSFHKSLNVAIENAKTGKLVTFGVVADTPETGYGYIKRGEKLSGSESFVVDSFIEKPDQKTAKEYIESGEYYWNSGMFVFKASRVLEELEKHVPEMVEACKKAIENGTKDLDFFRLDLATFENCPSDSIDYAIMEKTDEAVVVPLSAGWDDMGSWNALWQIGEKDENQNVIKGDVITHDVNSSLIYSQNRLVTAIGLDNHIIVETSDAILISPQNRVQEVKKIVEKLKLKNREEVLSHRKVYRPWGSYESIDIMDSFQVKRITVNPGSILSLQKHFHRAEHWVVVKGTALVTKGEREFLLKEDESTYIPLGVKHRLENPGTIALELIEVQTGSYLGEDDIVRYEDVYGR